jgi:hypothetical protein
LLACILLFAFGTVAPEYVHAGQKTVHVKEYKRKDGTVVKAHNRKANGAATPSNGSSKATHASTSGARSNRCDACDRDEHGRILRKGEARNAFKRATGYPRGRPGYVIDHIRPLACGGLDVPSNMQWQTVRDSKIKDKTERASCR